MLISDVIIHPKVAQLNLLFDRLKVLVMWKSNHMMHRISFLLIVQSDNETIQNFVIQLWSGALGLWLYRPKLSPWPIPHIYQGPVHPGHSEWCSTGGHAGESRVIEDPGAEYKPCWSIWNGHVRPKWNIWLFWHRRFADVSISSTKAGPRCGPIYCYSQIRKDRG